MVVLGTLFFALGLWYMGTPPLKASHPEAHFKPLIETEHHPHHGAGPPPELPTLPPSSAGSDLGLNSFFEFFSELSGIATPSTPETGEAGGKAPPASPSSAPPSPTPSPSPSPLLAANWYKVGVTTGSHSFPPTFSLYTGVPRATLATSHRCVGEWRPWPVRQGNRTCLFTNLYFDGVHDTPGKEVTWTYLVFAEDVEELKGGVGGEEAMMAYAQGIKSTTKVRLPPHNRDPAAWHLEVVVFVRVEGGPPTLVGSHSEYLEKVNGSDFSSNPALRTSPYPQAFLQQRAVPHNIGHTFWDDHMTWFGAMHDLGFGGQENEWQLLYTDHPLYPGQGFYGGSGGGGVTMKGVSKLHPVMIEGQAGGDWNDKLVRFPALAAGVCCRSSGGMPVDYGVGGRENRVVWRFRNHYLENMGLKGEDVNDWSAGPFPRPANATFKVMLIQKTNKRRVNNLDAIRSTIQARFPTAEVWIQEWESIGGHEAEVRTQLKNAIVITMDGTGSNTAFMLPPGSVQIQLGAFSAGRTGHIGDYIHSVTDHIKVLWYQGIQPGDDGGSPGRNQDKNIVVHEESLMPLVEEAVRLWQQGFPLPVAYPENVSPQGKFNSCLMRAYPALGWRASSWQGGMGCDAFNAAHENPLLFYLTGIRTDAHCCTDCHYGFFGLPRGYDATLFELPGFNLSQCQDELRVPSNWWEVVSSCAQSSGAKGVSETMTPTWKGYNGTVPYEVVSTNSKDAFQSCN